MPIIIVLIAVALSLLFGPLTKYVDGKQAEKFRMEDMGWGKKKGTEKPTKPVINYSKLMFVLFVLLLISMMTVFIIALVYPPL